MQLILFFQPINMKTVSYAYLLTCSVYYMHLKFRPDIKTLLCKGQNTSQVTVTDIQGFHTLQSL